MAMALHRRHLGKTLGAAPGAAVFAPPPDVDVARPAKTEYGVEHAEAVSDGAARSAAEGIAKTANNAQTVAQTGASPVVGVAGDLAVKAHEAAPAATQNVAIVAEPVAQNRQMVAGVHANLGPVSADVSVGAPRRAGAWLGWVVGGVAIGALIYMMVQPERRSRRSEE